MVKPLVHPSSTLDEGVRLILEGKGSIEIGRRCHLKSGVVINCYSGLVRIGERVSIGEYSVLYGHGGIEIEDTVIIGPHSLIAASSHIVGGKVECRFAGEMARGVRIGRNCWLGGRVTVLDGVVISEGAVIGAGSVVTRDVAAGCMVVGVPARPVRRVGLNPLYGCTTVE